MSIAPLPSLDRTSATFKTDVDTFFATKLPTFSTEAEAARSEIATNAATASSAATTATGAASTATTKASDAAGSASAAATSASNASTSASAAATSATNASGSASAAATSATNAAASASAAAASAASIAGGPVTSVNGKTGAATLSASDVGAVPTTRTVNGKVLSSDISLTAADVSAQATLVSGANIKTINGSSVLGSGDLTISSSTTAAQGASLVLLSTVTASASATVDIETTLDGTYDAYLIVAEGITSSAASPTLQCRLKVGGAYATSGYSFHSAQCTAGSATYNATNSTAAAAIDICTINAAGTTAGTNTKLEMWVMNPASTSFTKGVNWTGQAIVGSNTAIAGCGANSSTSALTGVRFFPNTGNIATGTFRLYGLKNS